MQKGKGRPAGKDTQKLLRSRGKKIIKMCTRYKGKREGLLETSDMRNMAKRRMLIRGKRKRI